MKRLIEIREDGRLIYRYYEDVPVERSPLPIDKLSEQLRYDPDTGDLYWLIAKRGLRAGAKAGCVGTNGYILVGINGKRLLAHRIAWAIYYGKWPTKNIDHINGCPEDNRIKNLRDVDHVRNCQNCVGDPHWHRKKKKWQVRLRILGKRVHVGYFNTFEEAVDARKVAADRLRGEYARTV